jgi:predicted ATPase
MIIAVSIRNFKNLRDQVIQLEPLTVFVGANGSGKTSVLDALNLAVHAVSGDPKEVFRDDRHCDWLHTRGEKGGLSISCTTRNGRFSFEASPPINFPPPTDLLGKGEWHFHTSPQGVVLEQAVLPARSMVLLRLNAAQLGQPSYSERDPPLLEENGQNLASVLAYMALNDPDTFGELVQHMRELIPDLRRIRFRKAPIQRVEKEYLRIGDQSLPRQENRTYSGEAILLDFNHADNIAAHTASEGTLILLGLLTVLLGPTRPKILLMDDIEHGLHPLAQKRLVQVIGQIRVKFPDLQLLATAHSPYLLNYLEPEQVRIMAVGPDGYARCGRLTDHPKFATWKEEMAPGEMWSLFGEKWLADKGATS